MDDSKIGDAVSGLAQNPEVASGAEHMVSVWDALRRRSECRHCHGTGRASGDAADPNECGFCEVGEPNLNESGE